MFIQLDNNQFVNAAHIVSANVKTSALAGGGVVGVDVIYTNGKKETFTGHDAVSIHAVMVKTGVRITHVQPSSMQAVPKA